MKNNFIEAFRRVKVRAEPMINYICIQALVRVEIRCQTL